jgi:hypothetical protein
MAKKKTPTKAEKAHMSKVASLGCQACLKIGYEDTPCEIHHLREGAGAGQRSSHYRVIGLCPSHHRTGPDSFHGNREIFISQFGTELDLFELVNNQVGIKQ